MWSYRAETDRVVFERHHVIEAIGELKASQVVQWRTRLLREVEGAARAEVVLRALERVVTGRRTAADQRELDLLLGFLRANYDHDSVLAVTVEGKVIGGVGDERSLEDPATRQALAAARRTGGAVLSAIFPR